MKINLETDALLVIDVQPTFMSGGGLAVADGDKIVPLVSHLMRIFPKSRRFATKDRHPYGHISLASSYVYVKPLEVLSLDSFVADYNDCPGINEERARFTTSDLIQYLAAVKKQVLWPDHAIDGTAEAELHPTFAESDFAHVLTKGMDPKCDSYSGFFDNLGRPTGLADILCKAGVKRCFFVGLAFDYCVGWSAEGAVKEGFEAVVIEDATRPVAFPADSVFRMYASFQQKGIKLIQSHALIG